MENSLEHSQKSAVSNAQSENQTEEDETDALMREQIRSIERGNSQKLRSSVVSDEDAENNLALLD